MISDLMATGLGLLAGAQHAATGPDHLAGVAPFAAGRGARGWRAGAAWGLGHATGALLAAVAALALYLGGYAAGSLLTLTVFAAVLGRALPGGSTRALRLSVGAASAASLLVGLTWIGLSP